MPEVIECVYEDGVLKPFEKIDLKETRNLNMMNKERGKEMIEKRWEGGSWKILIESLNVLIGWMLVIKCMC